MINEYEYGYLDGDIEMWPQWGAAFAVTMEYCKNKGLGGFGCPTKLGKKVMKEYEKTNSK